MTRKPFLGQHPDDRCEQSVVAGESRSADAGEQLGALGVRPQIKQRGPPHRADHHQILAAVLPQRRDDAAAAPSRRISCGQGAKHGRVGKSFQTQR